jgi:hypothetical protein
MSGNHWQPLYGTLTTGTLCGKWPDVGLWPVILSLADWHGVVDCTPAYITGVAGLPVEDVTACMKRFCEADPGSRSKDQAGARLVLIDPAARDWGWRVTNFLAYREKARLASKNEREVESGGNAKRLADRRGPPATADDRRKPTVTASNANANANANNEDPSARPKRKRQVVLTEFMEELKASYPARSGSQPWPRAERAAAARIEEGYAKDQMLAGVKRYNAFAKATEKVGTEFVQQAATFLGPDKAFLEHWDVPQLAGKGSAGNGDDPASRAWQALIDAKPRDARSQKALDKIGGWTRVSARTAFDSPRIEREFCNAWREAA